MSKQAAKLLVVYVPISAAESVKSAVFSAGGGVIGAYSHCAWQTVGQGGQTVRRCVLLNPSWSRIDSLCFGLI